jgi:pilus assembly protein FimV
VIDKLRIALAVVLVAVAGPAAALGLGQIQVKSKVDQPLLAEIPIISSDPGELEQLQARLASPETFRRIGLEPPTGAAADLQFAVALDARGNPVIRVTSSAPVSQPLVTFLVEVDWGTGRLVREYSALLDTPRTVSAPAQPPIEAPTLAPSNVIERPADIAAQPEVAPADVAVTPEATPADPDAVAVAPAPSPEPAAAPASAPVDITPAPEIASDALSVQRGQTLSQIAAQTRRSGYTLDQTMLALLRANPDAFIRGNINLLKAGAVLRMPDATEISQLSAGEAAVVVHDQIEQWRALRQPALQPAAVAAEPAGPTAPSASHGASSARVAGARLEIVPPSGGNRPGTRSGASAGGEGDMLRQELQQTKETLAARDAEVGELKARVAELEKLQQQQQSLIQMKDSALAAAEQRLAQASKAAPAQATTAPAQKPAEASVPTWLWGGAGLLVLGLVAWLATRRRAPRPEPRRGYDSASLAAGMPLAKTEPVDASVSEDLPAAVEAEAFDAGPGLRWNATPASAAAPVGAVPTWHGATVPAHVAEPATTSQQLELAKAYIDLGDDDAARVLLREILNGRDPAARDEAARMLRQL